MHYHVHNGAKEIPLKFQPIFLSKLLPKTPHSSLLSLSAAPERMLRSESLSCQAADGKMAQQVGIHLPEGQLIQVLSLESTQWKDTTPSSCSQHVPYRGPGYLGTGFSPLQGDGEAKVL